MTRVGIAADHGGFGLKRQMAPLLAAAGYEVLDFGAYQLNPGDDYPDFILPLAAAIAAGRVDRGVAICGSGVGASIAANKIAGVRAGLTHDIYCAHQGVEDDDMNVCCLGGQVIGPALAWDLIQTFLAARFSGAQRHRRRLAELHAAELKAVPLQSADVQSAALRIEARPSQSPQVPVVFLLDVDDTLLDGDRFVADFKRRLMQSCGMEPQTRYWQIFNRLRVELGYADYLGALQHYRAECPRDPRFLEIARYLLNYPFSERLLPGAMKVIAQLRKWGPTVILTDGDMVFQPHKLEQTRLFAAVAGHALIYVHKERELADVERRYPAQHYVLIDDKIRILTAAKQVWGTRLTTVLPRQGHYAFDTQTLAANPAPDITLEHIADLLDYDLAELLAPRRGQARLQSRAVLRSSDRSPQLAASNGESHKHEPVN